MPFDSIRSIDVVSLPRRVSLILISVCPTFIPFSSNSLNHSGRYGERKHLPRGASGRTPEEQLNSKERDGCRPGLRYVRLFVGNRPACRTAQYVKTWKQILLFHLKDICEVCIKLKDEPQLNRLSEIRAEAKVVMQRTRDLAFQAQQDLAGRYFGRGRSYSRILKMPFGIG